MARGKGRPFVKGQSGNPKGPAVGSSAALRDKKKRVAEALAKAKGLTPLEFMMDVLRNPKQYPFAARQWAAEKAAPYVHKKMPIAIEGTDNPLRIIDVGKLATMPQDEIE